MNNPDGAVIGRAMVEKMVECARAAQDRGERTYTTNLHRACAGAALAAGIKAGLPTTPGALAKALALVDNGSSWRQKLNRQGLKFDAPARNSLDGYIAGLEDEGAV